jgi:hypothetical protein
MMYFRRRCYIINYETRSAATFRKLTPMVWFIILVVITCGLALGLPPDPQMLHQLHISSLAYRIAVVALLIPYGIIWYAAFYAFAKLKEYAQAIHGSDDGEAFHSIMTGMGVLAFGLVVPTTISLVMQNIASHYHGFRPASVVILNYVGLLITLVSFLYISKGTHLLTKLSKNRLGLVGLRLFALLFITLATVFTYLVMNYHMHHNVYYLSMPFLVITFIVPALFAWFIALLSAYEFRLYAKFAKGLLYRRALRQLSYGIVLTIAGSVAIQFMNNTFAAEASKSLGSLLLVDYAVLAIFAVGLIMMALGTMKLKKIEEV